MEKILTQEEIDALFRATQKSQIATGAKKGPQKNVAKFNLREISQINKDQVRSLSTLHDSFARNLTNSLGQGWQLLTAAAFTVQLPSGRPGMVVVPRAVIACAKPKGPCSVRFDELPAGSPAAVTASVTVIAW